MHLSVGGNKDVGPAIVVVVADRHAHAESAARHARFLGHVGERAVAIVLVERVADWLGGFQKSHGPLFTR